MVLTFYNLDTGLFLLSFQKHTNTILQVGCDFEEYGIFSDCILWALSYTLSGDMWGDDLGKINKGGRYLTPLYGKII